MLGVLLTSFLYVAMIAFGWFPCSPCGNQACCPRTYLYKTVYATFTSASCACVDAKVLPLVWDSINGRWSASTSGGAIFDCGTADVEAYEFRLTCSGVPGGWVLTMSNAFAGNAAQTACDFSLTSAIPDTYDCIPFSLTFSGTMITVPTFTACTCAGNAFTITITD